MNAGEYLLNPCQASSLPFWKTELVTIPDQLSIVRDDEFSADLYKGRDEPYFKMIHDLKVVKAVRLPNDIEIAQCDIPDFANHIHECYEAEHLSPKELAAYRLHHVFQPDLWIALLDANKNRIVATGIAELDLRIGEGILEWIQVSPDYRRRGLGSFLVCELLHRMQGRAEFVTVSGRINNDSKPMALYESCGFTDPTIWHIISSE